MLIKKVSKTKNMLIKMYGLSTKLFKVLHIALAFVGLFVIVQS